MNILTSSPPLRDNKPSNYPYNLAGVNSIDNDSHFSNELFAHLKQNYEERIQSLENHIRETYNLIDNDEIIKTMKMNQATDDFCQQRIHEIVEDSLAGEKEAHIEKLNHANALLKTELDRLDQENEKMVQAYNEELAKFNSTIGEFKNALQKETQARVQTQQENEKLSATLSNFKKQQEEFIRHQSNSGSELQNEIGRLKRELESIRRQKEEVEQINKAKDDIIDEMTRDIETLKDEYIQLEKVNSDLNTEYSTVLELISSFKEQSLLNDSELRRLQTLLKKSEEEKMNLRAELEKVLRENSDLVNKSEYISSQVKRLVEDGKENTDKMIEEIKQQYKQKLDEQRKKLEDTNQLNESLKIEVTNLKSFLNETKSGGENKIVQLQNDMRVVKEEWERKCQEIELTFQNEIVDMQNKHQETVNNMQMEYQALMQKRIREAREEAENDVARIKAMERETRMQMDNRLTIFEKDYILKANHESMLSSEILNLRTKHINELKNIEERFEKDYALKLKEVVQLNKQEYEASIASLKAQNKSLEQQLLNFKTENPKLLEDALKEKEKYQKLRQELEESNVLKKSLAEELEETKQNLTKLRGLHNEEVRKNKKKDLEFEDIITANEVSKKKEADFNEIVALLKKEVSELKEQGITQGQKLIKANSQNISLTKEVEMLRLTLENADKEKQDYAKKISNLEIDLITTIKSEKEKQEKLDESLKELKETISTSKEKQTRLEEEACKWKETCKELEGRLSRTETKYKRKVVETVRNICRDVDGLKHQINRLKTTCQSELEQSKEDMQEMMRIVGREFRLRKERWELEKEKQARKLQEESERQREEREEYERTLGKYEKQISELAKEMQQNQKELQNSCFAAEDANEKAREFDKKAKALEEERNKLKEESEKKVKEFKQLQAFVETEMRRIKEESGNVVNQLVGRHKQEISGILVSLNKLKNGKVEKMRQVEEEVGRMQREYEKELQEVKTWYEKNWKESEKVAQDARSEMIELRKELEKVEEINKELKAENKRMIDTLEDKLKAVREMMKFDKEKQNNEKMIENLENERLRQNIKDLKIELSLKEDTIKELNKLIDNTVARDNTRHSVVQEKEFEGLGTKRHRKKELEELQTLLVKSMQDVERKSFRGDSKPERDQPEEGRKSIISQRDSKKTFERTSSKNDF